MDAKTMDLVPVVRASRRISESSETPALHLLGLDDAAAPSADSHARALADWVRAFLMRPHPDLGRPGHVCPFTAQSARLSLLRIGVSPLQPEDDVAIRQTMNAALCAFDALPCKRSARLFRTVIVGFPNCADPAGVATLRRVQNAMRHHSVVRAKMIGLFEPRSEAEGLINRQFRPLRSPIPALAVRMLVEQDAPFVLRNPLLVPIYLLKFPFAGIRRLVQGGWPMIKAAVRSARSRPAGGRPHRSS